MLIATHLLRWDHTGQTANIIEAASRATISGGFDGNGWARSREHGTHTPRALAGRAAARAVQADAPGVPDPPDGDLRRVSRGGWILVGDARGGHPHGQPRLAHLLLRTRWRARGGRRLSARARTGDVHRDGPAQARSAEGPVSG